MLSVEAIDIKLILRVFNGFEIVFDAVVAGVGFLSRFFNTGYFIIGFISLGRVQHKITVFLSNVQPLRCQFLESRHRGHFFPAERNRVRSLNDRIG